MRATTPALVVLTLLGVVLADTEIRNFRLPLQETAQLGPSDSIPAYSLGISSRQVELSVSDQQPDLRVTLDAEEHLGSFTARISWPASSPTAFGMTLHPSLEDDQVILYINSKPLSPRFPHRHHELLAKLPTYKAASPVTETDDGYNTTFHLVFEPLILGVIPQTSVPAIKYISAATIFSLLLVPFVIRFIERFAATLPESSPHARRDKAE